MAVFSSIREKMQYLSFSRGAVLGHFASQGAPLPNSGYGYDKVQKFSMYLPKYNYGLSEKTDSVSQLTEVTGGGGPVPAPQKMKLPQSIPNLEIKKYASKKLT